MEEGGRDRGVIEKEGVKKDGGCMGRGERRGKG